MNADVLEMDQTNAIGAVHIGTGEPPVCPLCGTNDRVMSYDGDGLRVCVGHGVESGEPYVFCVAVIERRAS